MKFLVAIVIILGAFFFMWKSNNADKERLAQVDIAHQQRLDKEKSNNTKELNTPEQPPSEVKEIKTSETTMPVQATADVKVETANNSKNVYSESEWLSICKSTAGAANAIMTSRQNGVAMTEMMDKVVSSAEPAIKDIIKAFVIDAYDRPRYNTSEYQQKAILDFENQAYLTCIKVRQ